MAYEDFQTFNDDQDEGNHVTVDSATKVSWSGLIGRNETAYVYKDYEVNHFAADFEHKFEMLIEPTGNNCQVAHWMLANVIGDIKDLIDLSEDAVYISASDNTELTVLTVQENGSRSNDIFDGNADTLYFNTLDRDDDGGANNTGQYNLYIRTESHTGTLRDTLTRDCAAGEQNDFRYLYVCSTKDDGTETTTIQGYTQNLDLQEAVGLSIPVAMHHYKQQWGS